MAILEYQELTLLLASEVRGLQMTPMRLSIPLVCSTTINSVAIAPFHPSNVHNRREFIISKEQHSQTPQKKKTNIP